MSLEPWPPLHKRPEFRLRLVRAIVLTILLAIVIGDIVQRGGFG